MDKAFRKKVMRTFSINEGYNDLFCEMRERERERERN